MTALRAMCICAQAFMFGMYNITRAMKLITELCGIMVISVAH